MTAVIVPIIADVAEISRRLTRRHGFEEGDLPPHVRASIAKTWGEPLTARRWSTASSPRCGPGETPP